MDISRWSDKISPTNNKSVYVLTIRSNCASCLMERYVGMCALQLGHSCLHLLKLSLMQTLQNRWPHCGFTFVSVQVSRQIAHLNSSETRSRRIWRGSCWGECDASTFVFIVICFMLSVFSYLSVFLLLLIICQLRACYATCDLLCSYQDRNYKWK